MLDVIIVPIQFLLIYLMCKDNDIQIVSLLLSLLFAIDTIKIPSEYYYFVHGVYDILMMYIIWHISIKWKRYVLFIITGCSLFMNIYEGLSYYQTFIYPYRDVIQWWMVEAMFIILAWNCNWRGLPNVKLRRNLLHR